MSVCRIIRCGEEDAIAYLSRRSVQLDTAVSEVVAGIIEDVRKRGDAALLDSARRFDSPDIASILVTQEEIERAEVSPARLAAIRHAISRVHRFHEAQLEFITRGWSTETSVGLAAPHAVSSEKVTLSGPVENYGVSDLARQSTLPPPPVGEVGALANREGGGNNSGPRRTIPISQPSPTGREELSEGRSPGTEAAQSQSPEGATQAAALQNQNEDGASGEGSPGSGENSIARGFNPWNTDASQSQSPVGAARFAAANAPSSQAAQPVTFSWQIPEPHGGHIGQRLRPLASAGIYVPGGLARYPSSVIMNGVPALVAGVENIAVCSPAGPDGHLSAPVLVAARECGISRIAKTGGAAAVAALAFGTDSVPKVAKIAGPGNRYVNEAKRQLWGLVGLDLYAGPSEVCVLVDDDANPEFAVADWLTQVEHAEDNAGFVVCLSESKLAEIMAAVERQLSGAPREHTMRQALADYGAAFVARDLQEAIEIVNAIAPEHLTLAVSDPDETAARIENAGCILLGEYTPESAGDYAIGPSHTLPTSTAARFASPLNMLDFMKLQSVSYLTKEDLKEIAPTIETFGEMEGFPTHANGARIRK